MNGLPVINDITTLENERKKLIRKKITILLITMALSIPLIIIFETIQIIFFFIVLALILSNLITISDTNRFTNAYKRLIILEVFKKLFTNITYLPEAGFNRDIIESTNTLKHPDRYTSNDYIAATYNNINFETADIHLENRYRDKDGHTHYSTFFKGQWYIFDFNKSFKSDLQIIESKFGHSKGLFTAMQFNKVELEDIEFNRSFKVYAKNDLDAFYILTPSIIERIKQLNNKVPGQLIFCFKDKKLHIGVDNRRDSFEVSLYKPINVEEIEQKTLEEINDIINFINDLKLDNSLFRKEV